jgi:NADPH-dependent FMN reductase
MGGAAAITGATRHRAGAPRSLMDGRAIALFASARRGGNTGKLMDCIAAPLGIEVVDLAQLRMAPYDYEHRNRGDDFEPLMMRVLEHGHLIFASPVYCYAVAPPMKVFLDRITDFLDLEELKSHARRLRTRTGYVVCTSIYDEPPGSFISAFTDNFAYFGMRFGGMAHVNCADGYDASSGDAEAENFAQLLGGQPGGTPA